MPPMTPVQPEPRMTAPRRVRPRLGPILLLLIAWVMSGPVHPVGAQAWHPPTDLPIVDPFRAPTSRFGAGNRGLEYGATGGETVTAVADGTVVFSGVVAGNRHLTVDHHNGLRSTYAYVSQALVPRGAQVRAGDPIATAAPGFHLTARLRDRYVDPALLFAGAEPIPVLVAGPEPRSSVLRGRWDSLIATATAVPGVILSPLIRSAPIAGEVLQEWRSQDCDSRTPVRGPVSGSDGGETGRAGSVEEGFSGRVLVQVAGLGSSSGQGSIGQLDPRQLGYDPSDVIGFSYAGGCTPEPFGVQQWGSGAGSGSSAESGSPGHWSDSLERRGYDAEATYNDVDIAATHLADLIEAVAEANPGAPIDIAAHSLGGVVTRRALEQLVARGSVLPARIVTIGSPHQGTALADVAVAAPSGGPLDPLVDRLGSIRDIHGADSVAQVASVGLPSLDPPSPPPPGVTVLTIGASTDVVVPGNSTWWEGAENLLIDTSPLGPPGQHVGWASQSDVHSELPGLASVSDAIARSQQGLGPQCQGLLTRLRARGATEVLDWGYDAAAVTAGVISLLG